MPRFVLTVLLFLCTATAAQAQEAVRFDRPLPDGLSARYLIESEQSFELNAPFLPGGRQHETITQTVGLSLAVGEGRVEVTILSIEFEGLSSLRGAASFNARAGDDPGPEPEDAVARRLRRALGPSIGKTFVLVVDGERTITAVRKPEGAMKGLSREERDAFDGVLGAARLTEVLQPLLRPLGAPEAVEAGDAWEHVFTERTPLGQLTFTSTHTYDGAGAGRARFAMTGDIRINAEGMGRDLEVERDEYAGAIAWDLAGGIATDVRSSVDLRYTLGENPPMSASVRSDDRVYRLDADDDAPDDITNLLERAIGNFGQPAMAAAVVDTRGLVAIGAAGTRMRGVDLPVTTGDRWHIGSCTKAMTATLLTMAIERSDLTLDATLAEVWPDLEDRMHVRYRNATLREVLAHRAGFPAMTDGAAPDRTALADLPADPREAREAFARRLLTAKDGQPYAPATAGAEMGYSNAGYGVAAAAAEALLDESWEDALVGRVFGPLGMTEAGFGWPASVSAQGQPRGHMAGIAGVQARPADDPYTLEPPIDPAGDVHASIGGWALYARDVLRALTGEESTLLDGDATHDLLTPAQGEDYAGGWVGGEAPGLGRIYGHDGSAGTFYATVWLVPERGIAVVVASNAGNGAEACAAVRDRLVERYAE